MSNTNSGDSFNLEARRESLARLVASAFSGLPADEISEPEKIDFEIADKLIVFLNKEAKTFEVDLSAKVIKFIETEIDLYLADVMGEETTNV